MTLAATITELAEIVAGLKTASFGADRVSLTRAETLVDQLRQRVADADQMAEREPDLWAAIERLDATMTEQDDSEHADALRLVLDSLEQGATLHG